jgi:hypothetical protein
MEETARTLSSVGLTPKVHEGAAEVFRFVHASPLWTQRLAASIALGAWLVLTGLLTDTRHVLVLVKTPLSQGPTCLLRSARYATLRDPFPGHRR